MTGPYVKHLNACQFVRSAGALFKGNSIEEGKKGSSLLVLSLHKHKIRLLLHFVASFLSSILMMRLFWCFSVVLSIVDKH